MKRFFPFILAASLAVTGCSKSDSPSPEPKTEQETKSDVIRDKFKWVLPELRDYTIINEGITKDKKYKVVVGSNETDLVIAYIDDIGKVAAKGYKKLSIDLKGKVGSIDFAPDNQIKQGDAAIIAFKTVGGSKLLSYGVVYPHNTSINVIESKVTDDNNAYLLSLTFTNKTVWFLSNGKVNMFVRANGEKVLESGDTSVLLERSALAIFYFEENRMILIKNELGGFKVSCHPLTSASGNFVPFWEKSIKRNGDINKDNIVITDEPDNIVVTLTDDTSVYKFKKSNGELVE
ncbi:hypothetical protein [Sphingobacterium sp. UGAL515B_05]|uniref:hypothetical protein n=1 Tax=Sphingobacterium sp. UGAL515B_05 TaxID=2986767 RepID=UPI002953B9B2|nr:hypothetical protein [Sphingobacterium sp. UGAL515B_05]WON94774.1 hypothetical protein OK025_26505 [Sphingobacterium sp. UGAL515B_05]